MVTVNTKRTIGFPISHKENENRRVLIPEHIKLMQCPENLYFESGYGDVLGLTDENYASLGCHMVSRAEVLVQDIICDPKIGNAEYLEDLHEGQSIFGWIYATQNPDITDKLLNAKLTAYAWENMHYHGRHVFCRNNKLAGEAAIIHAFQCYGKMPYETKVAVLGGGNTAQGAIRILNMLGARVMQYDCRTEKLFQEELGGYDVIVNCILCDVTRTDHIVYKTDLTRMKRNSMIVDISCDKHGGIETSVPATFEQPVYTINGILHYAVDYPPSLFFKTFTYNNSKLIVPYLEELMKDRPGAVLTNSVIIRQGMIIDPSINKFQRRQTILQ